MTNITEALPENIFFTILMSSQYNLYLKQTKNKKLSSKELSIHWSHYWALSKIYVLKNISNSFCEFKLVQPLWKTVWHYKVQVSLFITVPINSIPSTLVPKWPWSWPKLSHGSNQLNPWELKTVLPKSQPTCRHVSVT